MFPVITISAVLGPFVKRLRENTKNDVLQINFLFLCGSVISFLFIATNEIHISCVRHLRLRMKILLLKTEVQKVRATVQPFSLHIFFVCSLVVYCEKYY